jgi:hypothetical protein
MATNTITYDIKQQARRDVGALHYIDEGGIWSSSATNTTPALVFADIQAAIPNISKEHPDSNFSDYYVISRNITPIAPFKASAQITYFKPEYIDAGGNKQAYFVESDLNMTNEIYDYNPYTYAGGTNVPVKMTVKYWENIADVGKQTPNKAPKEQPARFNVKKRQVVYYVNLFSVIAPETIITAISAQTGKINSLAFLGIDPGLIQLVGAGIQNLENGSPWQRVRLTFLHDPLGFTDWAQYINPAMRGLAPNNSKKNPADPTQAITVGGSGTNGSNGWLGITPNEYDFNTLVNYLAGVTP